MEAPQYGHLNIVCLPAIGIRLVNSKCLFLKLPVSKDLCRQETILKLLFKNVLIDSLLCCENFRKISWTPLAARHLGCYREHPSAAVITTCLVAHFAQILQSIREHGNFSSLSRRPALATIQADGALNEFSAI